MSAATLSYGDFKKVMRTSIRSSGVVDSLKTQVRASLAKELHAQHLMKTASNAPGSVTLRHKATESLVAEFLASSNLPYTLSIFQPESSGGLNGAYGPLERAQEPYFLRACR